MIAAMVRCLATLLALAGFSLAADLTGIWMGQVPGRNGEVTDVAFQFKPAAAGVSYTAVQFGDEFDLPVKDLKISGEEISFTVSSVNFYDGRQITFAYKGTVKDREIILSRERAGGSASNRPQDRKQAITLKKIL